MGNYSSLVLHVFSGTGNSLCAAGWLAERFGRDKTSITHIGKTGGPSQAPPPGTITGFVYPTHGFTAPWIVMRHALRLPRVKDRAAFVMAARAGTWPGFLLPGLSAGALFIVALILIVRGYRIVGLKGLDMPSNWMALHWGMSEKNARKILTHTQREVEDFAQVIFGGGRHLITFNNAFELVCGVALIPISAAYLLIGRFGLAKLFYANWRCNACGLCARDCPVGAIVMRGRDNPRPYWTFACESCMHCMGYCPEKAVEASHPLAVLLYFVCSFSLSGALAAWLIRTDPAAATMIGLVTNPWLQALLDYAYILMAFALVYALFSSLVRIPLVNRVFSSLTLTHYYRRYHAPDITPRDLEGR